MFNKKKSAIYIETHCRQCIYLLFIHSATRMRHLLAVSYPGPAHSGWYCHGLHTRAPCRGRCCGSGRFLTSGTFSRARTVLCATADCSVKPAAAKKAPKIGGRAAPGSSSPPHVKGRSPANRPRAQPQASRLAPCFVRVFWLVLSTVRLFKPWVVPAHSCSAVRNNELQPDGDTELRWVWGRRESEPGPVLRSALLNRCLFPPSINFIWPRFQS